MAARLAPGPSSNESLFREDARDSCELCVAASGTRSPGSNSADMKHGFSHDTCGPGHVEKEYGSSDPQTKKIKQHNILPEWPGL